LRLMRLVPGKLLFLATEDTSRPTAATKKLEQITQIKKRPFL
jgi:hypothetical protein